MWGFITEYSEWIILGIIGGLVAWGKIKVKNMEGVVKESTEFINELKKALADGKITAEEFGALIKEGKDVLTALTADKDNND